MIKEKLIKSLLGKEEINMAVICPHCKHCGLKSRYSNNDIILYCPDCGELGRKAFKDVV